jgi:hypothetical protein
MVKGCSNQREKDTKIADEGFRLIICNKKGRFQENQKCLKKSGTGLVGVRYGSGRGLV